MGHCMSKNISSVVNTDAVVAAGDRRGGGGRGGSGEDRERRREGAGNGNGVMVEYQGSSAKNTPARSFTASPSPSPYPVGIMPSPSPARATPRRFWPFPPPSPAKPILTMLRRQGRGRKQNPGTIQEDGAEELGEGATTTTLDKTFDYARNFGARFELGKEVGRGHFGHTCWATGKKGALKGQAVAVKIISKDKVRVNGTPCCDWCRNQLISS